VQVLVASGVEMTILLLRHGPGPVLDGPSQRLLDSGPLCGEQVEHVSRHRFVGCSIEGSLDIPLSGDLGGAAVPITDSGGHDLLVKTLPVGSGNHKPRV